MFDKQRAGGLMRRRHPGWRARGVARVPRWGAAHRRAACAAAEYLSVGHRGNLFMDNLAAVRRWIWEPAGGRGLKTHKYRRRLTQ